MTSEIGAVYNSRSLFRNVKLFQVLFWLCSLKRLLQKLNVSTLKKLLFSDSGVNAHTLQSTQITVETL